jgi:hypothetical protein
MMGFLERWARKKSLHQKRLADQENDAGSD